MTHIETDIRLNCQLSAKRGQNGRGKQQNWACLHVRLRPPASYSSLSESSTRINSDEDLQSNTSSCTFDRYFIIMIDPILIDSLITDCADTLSSPSTATGTDFDPSDVSSPIKEGKPKRRRIRGYSVDPDNEDMDDEYSIEGDFDDFYSEDDHLLQNAADLDCVGGIIEVPPISIGSWMVASLLPRYVDQISIESTSSVAESTVSHFSIYRELRDASLDEDFEKVKTAMMTEWTYVGACLIALATLDATIFSTTSGGTNTPGSTSGFQMTQLTQQLIALSSCFTGLGLVIDAWFVFRYGIASAAKFQRIALDVYDTYLSFSVTSRIPIIFTFFSACCLTGFLVVVSASVWPTAAIVLCGFAGIVCTMQYLIYGLHSLWCFGQRMLRTIRNGVVRGCAWIFGKSTDPGSNNTTAAVMVESPSPGKIALPPPTHLLHTSAAEAPNRPPRNPARTPAAGELLETHVKM